MFCLHRLNLDDLVNRIENNARRVSLLERIKKRGEPWTQKKALSLIQKVDTGVVLQTLLGDSLN